MSNRWAHGRWSSMILEKLPGVNDLSEAEKWQFIDELWKELLRPQG